MPSLWLWNFKLREGSFPALPITPSVSMSHFWNNHVILAAARAQCALLRCSMQLLHLDHGPATRNRHQAATPTTLNSVFTISWSHFLCQGIKSTCLNYAQCFLSKYLRWTTFMGGCTAPHCHCPSVTSWTCWVGLTTIIFICLIAIAEIAAQNDLYVQQSVAPRTGASQIYPYLAV